MTSLSTKGDIDFKTQLTKVKTSGAEALSFQFTILK